MLTIQSVRRDSGRLSRFLRSVFLVSMVCLFIYGPAHGTNLISIDVVVSGGSVPVDTIYTGQEYEFRLWFENDAILGGISHGFTVQSPDGATVAWLPSGGLGDHEAATVASGCRMDPPTTVFDVQGGLIVSERGVDGMSPDTFFIGGVSIYGGMAAGVLEHMISLHFIADGPTGEETFTLCIDSCFIPPYGDFIYSFPNGSGVVPITNWPSGGACWPVRVFPNECPTWDAGLPDTLFADHCKSGQVTLSADDPEGDSIIFGPAVVAGGAGIASLADHGNGTMNLTYTPHSSDVGMPISITVGVTDTFHAAGYCTPYVIDVAVTNKAPQIDCGMPVYKVNEGNHVIKTDIRAIDADGCDNLAFIMISGSGSINPVSGVYSWPSTSGVGQWPITVGVTDSYDTAQCGFTVDIQAAVPDTCAPDQQNPGDVNNDGEINSSDAVNLTSFWVTGSPVPPILANADVNGDCFIDQDDMYYLLAAIFSGGPDPVECTCVNPFVCRCGVADANDDGAVNVGDAVYIINYVFKQGSPPTPHALCSGDANTDCAVNVADAVYVINYVFKSGPRPSYCHEWLDQDTGCGWIVRE